MTTYVICHGATAGGWYMRKLEPFLRDAGHAVFLPTLTGLGERAHLTSPAIDLYTHIQDVVNVLNYEDLHDVVLVGKSYSGMVITGVAEEVPERLCHLVYVDAFSPQHGQSLLDLLEPAGQDSLRQMVKQYGDGWLIQADRSVEGRFSAQPYKTFTQQLAVENPAAATLPRTFIRCTGKPAHDPISRAIDRCAELAIQAGWRYRELATGHEPERDAPERLSELLLELSR